MKITEEIIEKFSTKQALRSGKQAFLRGAVTIEELSLIYVRGTVKGAQLYTVELHDRGNSEYETSCTCPFEWGGDCKHIVAVSYAAMEGIEKLAMAKSIADSNEVAEPPAGKRESWKDLVTTLHPAGSRPPSVSSGAKGLAYGLEIVENERRLHSLVLRRQKGSKSDAAVYYYQIERDDSIYLDLTDRFLMPQVKYGFINTVRSGLSDRRSRPDDQVTTWVRNDERFNDVLLLLQKKEMYLIGEGPVLKQKLSIVEDAAEFAFELEDASSGMSLKPVISLRGNDLTVHPDYVVLANDPLWILNGNEIVSINGIDGEELDLLLKGNAHPVVDEADRLQFLQEGLPVLLRKFKFRSKTDIIRTIEVEPIPLLYLRENDTLLTIELRFQYDQFELKAIAPVGNWRQDLAECYLRDGKFIRVVRSAAREQDIFSMLSTTNLRSVSDEREGVFFTPTMPTLGWLLEHLPAFQSAGYQVFGQESLSRNRLNYSRPTLSMYVSSGIDWFDLNLDLSFEGMTTSVEAVEETIRKNERFIKLKDGSYGVLPEQWVKRFKSAFAFGSMKNKKLRFARTQVGFLDDLLNAADAATPDAEYRSIRERLRSFERIERVAMPKKFQGELRPYQRHGYEWLHFLRDFKFGGILADDMGLGKTVQTLALLQKIYEDGSTHPSLIIVPTSLLFNWQNEIQRFTPSLRVLMYRGIDRKDRLEEFDEYDLIVTSYGILRRDIEILKDLFFEYVILDESQNIKNFESVNAKSSYLLQADHRLALTGTPVENNLLELWAQFAYLNPGMLGNVAFFVDQFAKPIERIQDEEAASMLRNIVFPFILRRTKELVAQDLPPKVESVVICEMEQTQRDMYNQWRDYFRTSILKKIDESGVRSSKMIVLEGLMRLRQICCHPLLVDADYVGPAAKFTAFVEMLDDIVAEGHKVLVFSQFVKMLKILRTYCDEHNFVYEYLDGHTVDREARVNRFQNDEQVKLFLISLKAGGTGLNLTAADYVIIYDPWWNPAVEIQATDRTHRIGQTKNVFSYKLLTKDSVEEKIVMLQEKKKALVRQIIATDADFFKKLTREDVESLFS